MIVPVIKFRVTGLIRERRKIIEALKTTASVEFTKQTDMEGFSRFFDNAAQQQLTDKLAEVKFGIDFINWAHNEFKNCLKKHDKLVKEELQQPLNMVYEKIKKPLFSVRDSIDYVDFQLITTQENEILAHLDYLHKAHARYHELSALAIKNKQALQELQSFRYLDVPLAQICDTKTCFVSLYSVVPSQLEELTQKLQEQDICVYSDTQENTAMLIAIGFLSARETCESIISSYSATQCPFTEGDLPRKMIADLRETMQSEYIEHIQLIHDVSSMTDVQKQLKIYYDYLLSEKETIDAQVHEIRSQKSFIICGFCPKERKEEIFELLKQTSEYIYVQEIPPDEGEVIPTLLKNNKVTESFNSITNLYAPPSYNEFDPNPVMSVFFVIIFGLMLGDAGYGIVLTIMCALALKFLKVEKPIKNMLVIFFFGGISSIIFGAMLGGWFALTKDDGTPLGTSIMPGFLDPLTQPLQMIGVCMALGVLHICAGIVLKMIKLIKEKQVVAAILQCGSRLLLFAGIGLFLCSFLTTTFPQYQSTLSTISTIGSIITICSALGVFLSGAHNKKGFNRLTGGIGALYSLISYVADILSYSRIFGLALSGAVIGLVANMMAKMLFGLPLPFGIAIGVIVAVVLHLFNIVIGLLGIYVHNARLQFVEFFSKFYEGSGKQFVPIGQKTKYNIINYSKINTNKITTEEQI